MLANDALEANLAKLRDANIHLRMQGGKARTAHEKALQSLRNELEGQRLQLCSGAGRLAALEAQVPALEAGGRAGNAQGMAERVRVLEWELAQAEAQNSEAGHWQLEGLRGKVGELETALAEKGELAGGLKREVQGIIRAREEAERSQVGLREALKGAEGTLERERAALRARVWALQGETNRLGAEREEAVGALQREVASLGEVQSDLEGELMELHGEKAELLARIEQLEKQQVCGDYTR
jgi:predicted  nucleic acid-binding Zn-ribbon protein